MRAKTVNESHNKVSYEEAVEFVKRAALKNPKYILGPSIGEVYNKTNQYYVKTGGISRKYEPEDLKELLHAMQIVQDQHNNVTWAVSGGSDLSIPRITFDSDEERRTGEGISQYYREIPSSGFTGD